MSTGNLNDGLIAYANGRMVVLRVPYPIGFYAKGFDGRIDDPNAGWKGRGLWAANGDRTPWLIEGGKGTQAARRALPAAAGALRVAGFRCVSPASLRVATSARFHGRGGADSRTP